MTVPAVTPLSPDQLYRVSDTAQLDFQTTRDAPDGDGVLGQDRALKAIRFGAQIDRPGYNLFLLGASGTGKHSTARRLLEDKAAAAPPPDDWAYVNNFAEPHRPKVLRLPNGRGTQLRAALHALTDDIRAAIPAAFEAEDYQNRRHSIEEEFQRRQQEAFQALQDKAEKRGIALVRTPMGFALAPVRGGKIVRPDTFEKLGSDEQERIQQDIRELEAELEQTIKQIPRWNKEQRDALRKLNEEVTAYTIGHPIEELLQTFADLPQVLEYLDAVRHDLIENVHGLISGERSTGQGPESDGESAPSPGLIRGFNRYEINLIVGNARGDGAPVVYEDNPTLANLVGRVEHISQMGALLTNFSLIKPGALHRANGGYLILDALKVLTKPFAWEALKRVLKAGHITIESPSEMLGLVSTISLEPEPVPLHVKVVLSGEPLIYYLLSALDPEFAEMFKVAADFDDAMARDAASERSFASMLAEIARREKLRPFGRDAVGRVIEHAARLADDAEKLSIRLEPIIDLLREADFFAGEAGAAAVEAAHVQEAIDARIHRLDRLRERSQEAVERGILLIDTDGEKVGQINGLSYLRLGEFAFGRPTRITARVRLGAGKVVDIEREVELGGPLHSKGVMILAGYLGSHFATDTPLSLSASLVFEQSYGGVEGDSASSAELYALLSALAEVPIRQSLAVTGSVNQRGEVQAIGGVNEKIEGFFDLCAARGLTGEQGVLIPATNTKHLMLHRRVVEAVEAGRFQIYPVETIDQGLALLSGLTAGERAADGSFPDGSFNRLVDARLTELAEKRRAFGRSDKAGEDT